MRREVPLRSGTWWQPGRFAPASVAASCSASCKPPTSVPKPSRRLVLSIEMARRDPETGLRACCSDGCFELIRRWQPRRGCRSRPMMACRKQRLARRTGAAAAARPYRPGWQVRRAKTPFQGSADIADCREIRGAALLPYIRVVPIGGSLREPLPVVSPAWRMPGILFLRHQYPSSSAYAPRRIQA